MTARCASTFTTRPCHLASEMSLEVAAGGLERRPSFTLVATWRPRIERSRRTDDEGAREGIHTPVNAGSAHVARGERRYNGYWVNSLCFKRTRRIYLVMLVRGRHTDATNSAEPRRRPATRSETGSERAQTQPSVRVAMCDQSDISCTPIGSLTGHCRYSRSSEPHRSTDDARRDGLNRDMSRDSHSIRSGPGLAALCRA